MLGTEGEKASLLSVSQREGHLREVPSSKPWGLKRLALPLGENRKEMRTRKQYYRVICRVWSKT